jgi:regulator of RNase E activity RraA
VPQSVGDDTDKGQTVQRKGAADTAALDPATDDRQWEAAAGKDGRYRMIACQVPILLSGETTETVRVDPGDFIFGEADGALVIPKHLTLQVLSEGERISGIEDKARREFARGDDPVEVFKRLQ